MKKQFFYAAFAIALMASCTSENEPVVEQPTPEAEDKVAIELGVKTPNIVGSRGTGTVGNVAGESDATTWEGQELKIIMVNKETNTNLFGVKGEKTLEKNATESTEDDYIFEDLRFFAPNGTDNNIKIYSDYETGVIKHKYYPVSGTFDFYGYHVDDAATASLNETINETTAEVTGITIDGTQDILAATTIKIPSTQGEANELTGTTTPTPNPNYNPYWQENAESTYWTEMNSKQFSARTARNGFTPILDFKHQLARLKFYVKSGNAKSGAEYEEVADKKYSKRSTSEVEVNGETYELANGAIYITGITALDMYESIKIDLFTQTSTVDNADAIKNFTLRSEPADDTETKLTEHLTPVAPKFPTAAAAGDVTITDNEIYSATTPVGESMMFLPHGNTESSITLKLDLLQRVLDEELENDTDETDPNNQYPKYIDKKMEAYVVFNANKIDTNGDGVLGDIQSFAAGSSYNVYITIYGLEEIKLSAKLTAWTDGGDVDLDIENDAQTDDDDAQSGN